MFVATPDYSRRHYIRAFRYFGGVPEQVLLHKEQQCIQMGLSIARSNLFFQLVTQHYECGSLLVTSNRMAVLIKPDPIHHHKQLAPRRTSSR